MMLRGKVCLKVRLLSTAMLCLSLNACKSTDHTAYQKEALASLAQTEQRIVTQLANLHAMQNESGVSIKSLRNEVTALSQQIADTQALLATYTAQQTAQIVSAEPEEPQTVVTNNGSFVLGAVERVTIEAIGQQFDARIDTGAATSSINAVDIEVFERDGDDWVRFHILDESNQPTEDNWVEVPVVRFVNIRQVSSAEAERRPVVKLWTQLGEMRDNSEFTLADRSHMSHPVLLGREFMRDVAIVDVSKEFVQSRPQ